MRKLNQSKKLLKNRVKPMQIDTVWNIKHKNNSTEDFNFVSTKRNKYKKYEPEKHKLIELHSYHV